MTIQFTKTGRQTGSFAGDLFKTEYSFVNEGTQIASCSCVNFGSALKIGNDNFSIAPVLGVLIVKEYLISDSKKTIGKIRTKRSSWAELDVFDQTFKMDKVYKSFWHRFINANDYHVRLSSNLTDIDYIFKMGKYFEKGHLKQRYRELSGQINTPIDALAASILGVFLLEIMLELEDY